jgi:hypothetical protein
MFPAFYPLLTEVMIITFLCFSVFAIRNLYPVKFRRTAKFTPLNAFMILFNWGVFNWGAFRIPKSLPREMFTLWNFRR